MVFNHRALKDKNTALHFSIIQKNYEAVELLIDSGVEIDAQNADKRTPLMLAALAGDEHLTNLLLEYNADKTTVDQSGKKELSYKVLLLNKLL